MPVKVNLYRAIKSSNQYGNNLEHFRPLLIQQLGRHHWWKNIFDGRTPLMEEPLWSKETLDGGQPLMEDDPQMEDNF